MSLAASLWFLVIIGAGIGLISTFVVLLVNDLLRKNNWSKFNPDEIIGKHILGVTDAAEASADGRTILFLLGWLAAIGFLVLWSFQFFQSFSAGNILIASLTYSFASYFVLNFIIFPLLHLGFFGTTIHERTPFVTAFLLLVYACCLWFLVPIF